MTKPIEVAPPTSKLAESEYALNGLEHAAWELRDRCKCMEMPCDHAKAYRAARQRLLTHLLSCEAVVEAARLFVSDADDDIWRDVRFLELRDAITYHDLITATDTEESPK